MKKLSPIFLLALVTLSCNAGTGSPSAPGAQKTTTNQASNNASATSSSPGSSQTQNDPEASFKAFCAALPSWVAFDSNNTFSFKLRDTDNVYPGGGDGRQTAESISGNCTPGKMSISLYGSVSTPSQTVGWDSKTVSLHFNSPLNSADTPISYYSSQFQSADNRIESSGTVSNVVFIMDHSKGTDVSIEFDYQVTQSVENLSGIQHQQNFNVHVEADVNFPHALGDNVGFLMTSSATEEYSYR